MLVILIGEDILIWTIINTTILILLHDLVKFLLFKNPPHILLHWQKLLHRQGPYVSTLAMWIGL